jgi:teichuronic acid biosynthesis glycosyltransferase TuaC
MIITLPRANPATPPDLRVLSITNMWPSESEPVKGIFCARQMRSLGPLNIAVDVLAIAGKENAAASLDPYLRAASVVLGLNFGPRRYDLIHAHTGHCGLVACLQVRYPIVMSYVGYDIDTPAEDREGLRTGAERIIFRQLSRYLAATIAKSARGARQLPAGGRRRNFVLPNGVDRDVFAPMDRQEARRALNWAVDDHPVALFLGDPARVTKRVALAEAAVAAARAQVPELELRICANTPPELVPRVMSASDLLLLTSVAEGSPNVVKEAMACDLPVVSVDVGDVRENLEGVRHCHVCPAEPQPLAEAIVSVVRALPERSDGRVRSEHLGLEPIARTLASIYRAAAN